MANCPATLNVYEQSNHREDSKENFDMTIEDSACRAIEELKRGRSTIQPKSPATPVTAENSHKQNKQQNLNTLISSNATGSTSGQGTPSSSSPSPPQLSTDSASNGGNGSKRPNEENYDPVPSKKRRISHFLTKERVGNHMNPSNASNLVQQRNVLAVKDGPVCNGTTDVTNISKISTQFKRKSAAIVYDQSRKGHKDTKENMEQSQTKTDLLESSKTQSSHSGNKGTTRRSKSKKDTEESPRNTHAQSKPDKTVPKSTNDSLEASNQVKNQSSQQQHSDSQLQQQISASKPASQHSVISDGIGYDFSSYPPITSIDERRMYKAEFQREHEEHCQLLEYFQHVRRSCQTLSTLLEQLPPDSPRYADVYRQIMEKYARGKSSAEIQRKQRYEYLHAKLSHITRLVSDYDKILTAAIEAEVLRHKQQQQQQNAPIAPVPEVEEMSSPNSCVSAMGTKGKPEAEIVQTLEVHTQGSKYINDYSNYQGDESSSSDSDDSSDSGTSDDSSDESSSESSDGSSSESSDDSD